MEGMDFITGASFLIGGLSVLVMFLLGWQIWAIWRIKKEVRDQMKGDIQKIKDDLHFSVGKIISDIAILKTGLEKSVKDTGHDAFGKSMYNVGDALYMNKMYEQSFDCYMKAIMSFYAINPKGDLVGRCFIMLGSIINKINEDESYRFTLDKRMVESYIGILDPMINDDRKIPIYKFILNIETVS